jgi:hypothetical protein
VGPPTHGSPSMSGNRTTTHQQGSTSARRVSRPYSYSADRLHNFRVGGSAKPTSELEVTLYASADYGEVIRNAQALWGFPVGSTERNRLCDIAARRIAELNVRRGAEAFYG